MLNFKIKCDVEKDKISFKKFLFEKKHIHKRWHVRKSIFFCYSSLANIENISQAEWEKLVDNFLEQKYFEYKYKIDDIIKKWKKLFNWNKQKIVEGFCKTMDYQINNETVHIYPSFLPSSTFGSDIIKFSIVTEVFKNQENNYLDIFLHEYCHIIREKQIKNVYSKIWELSDVWHDYLKEIIAPVIVRDSFWDGIRQWENIKYANTRQQLLNISVDWKSINLVDCFEKNYIDSKREWLSFEQISINFVKIFNKIQNQIEEKHKIWSQVWFNLANRAELKKVLEKNWYMKDIIL